MTNLCHKTNVPPKKSDGFKPSNRENRSILRIRSGIANAVCECFDGGIARVVDLPSPQIERRWKMAPPAASSTATETVKPALAPARTVEPEHVPTQAKPNWQKYGTPLLVVLLAATVVFTITRN